MILKGMAAYEHLVLQAKPEVPFLRQIVLVLHVHLLVPMTLSTYCSPLAMLQSLQPVTMHIQELRNKFMCKYGNSRV